MKRNLLLTLLALLFLPLIEVEAKTLVTQKQTSVGIHTELLFEEGFVGGVDLTLKIEGNVELKNIVWSSNLNNYTKNYIYNKENQTIRIFITTGKNTLNLVDKKKVLDVGDLVITGEESSTYSFNGSNITIIDASYQSKEKNDLEVIQEQFIIPKKETPTPPVVKPDDKDDNKEEQTPSNPEEDKKSEENPTPTEPTTPEEDTKPEENEKPEEDKKTEETQENNNPNKTPSENQGNAQNNSSSQTQNNTTTPEDKPNSENPSKEEQNPETDKENTTPSENDTPNITPNEEDKDTTPKEEDKTEEKVKRNLFEDLKYRLLYKTEHDWIDYLLIGTIVVLGIVVLSLMTRRRTKTVSREKTILDDDDTSEKEDNKE